MKKKDIIKHLVENYNGKRARFSDYDVVFQKDGKEYYAKILQVSSSNQITINSTIIWEIKSGRISGVRYKATSSRMIDLSTFRRYENKVLLFTDTPYRVLKYLNESDLVDVSNEHNVHGIFYLDSVQKIDANL